MDRLATVIDLAHAALRGIDAADQTSVIPAKQLDAVSEAVAAIERFARERGIVLSENRPIKATAALSRAMGGGDDLMQTIADICRPVR